MGKKGFSFPTYMLNPLLPILKSSKLWSQVLDLDFHKCSYNMSTHDPAELTYVRQAHEAFYTLEFITF